MPEPDECPEPLTIDEATTPDQIRAWIDSAQGRQIYAVSSPDPNGNISQMLGHPADAELPVDVTLFGEAMTELNGLFAQMGYPLELEGDDLFGPDMIGVHWQPTGHVAIVNNGQVSDEIARLIAR